MKPDAARLTPLVDNLHSTLLQEQAALDTLADLFTGHLDALRQQRPDLLEETTLAVNEGVAGMERLRNTRLRQMRLLGRMLGLAPDDASLQGLGKQLRREPALEALGTTLLCTYDDMQTHARQTQKLCEQVEFALEYAARLGRELLGALQDLDQPPPAHIYTARGRTSQNPRGRSFLNQIG